MYDSNTYFLDNTITIRQNGSQIIQDFFAISQTLYTGGIISAGDTIFVEAAAFVVDYPPPTGYGTSTINVEVRNSALTVIASNSTTYGGGTQPVTVDVTITASISETYYCKAFTVFTPAASPTPTLTVTPTRTITPTRTVTPSTSVVVNTNSACVAGAGTALVNGTYTYTAFQVYDFGTLRMSWNGGVSNWQIRDTSTLVLYYASGQVVTYPWQVTIWTAVNGIAPVPTVTEGACAGATPTPTATLTATPTPTPTLTPTRTITPTRTVTPSRTITPTITQTITPTRTVTPSITPSQGGVSIVRTFYEAPYTATRTTRQGTNYVNIANMSASGAANTRTAIFWMATGDINDTGFDVRLRLTGSNSTTVIQLENMEPQDTTDRMSMGGLFPYSSSTAVTWSIQHSEEDGGTTSGYSGRAMVGLLLTGSDLYNSASAAANTTSTTYASYTSVTVPAGTYVIVGSAAIGSNNTAGNPRFRIFDGTNTYGELLDTYLQDVNGRSPYWHVFRRTVASSTTFNLQYRGDGTNQGIMLQGSILALDTSKFANVYYAENTGSFSSTNMAYVDAFTASFTIANPSNKHILLASAMLSGSVTNSSFACKLRNTTTATDYTVENLREPNATSEEMPTVVARTVTFSGASNTIAWQLDVETAATTGHLKNMMIILLDTGRT